jgi:nucleotide-binding universal stress UspA family protein
MSDESRTKNIILAIDGSEYALAAIKLLTKLSLPTNAIITTLAVVDVPTQPRHYALQQALEQANEKIKLAGFKVNSDLLHGHPANELILYADHVKPDLILMGARGLRATLGILLGGVAQQVVEHANWPVLIARGTYQDMQNILLALDGSPCSQNALEYLGKFPLPKEAQVSVLHVLPPPVTEQDIISATWAAGVEAISTRPTLVEELERASKEEEEKSEKLLAYAVDRLKSQNITASSLIKRGDAATEILSFTKENPVDLIVAGSRGLSAISGWLLGSVSRKIVHYAACSVLIVKGEHCTAKT